MILGILESNLSSNSFEAMAFGNLRLNYYLLYYHIS